MGIDDQFRPYTKIFPATELKPYAEPVSSEQLREGRVYFALQFLDADLLVPVLQPLLFLGCDLDGNDPKLRFFQDFESFAAGVQYSSGSNRDSEYFHSYAPDECNHIFDYEHALQVLMKCALKRRETPDFDERIRRKAE